MKILFVLMVIIFNSEINPQSASSFFPQNHGYVWRYKMIPLDTLNNPIDSLVFYRVDSLTTTANLYNRSAKVVLTKVGDDPFLYLEPYLDTILYSFDQTIGYEYLGMSQLEAIADLIALFIGDTTLGVYNFFRSFVGWHSYYRFASQVNQQYTILSRDTTFTIDTLSLPLRFQILGKRFNDQTITTDIGTFNCKKFTLEWRLSYLLVFPPPIPPVPVKLIGIVDTLWIAPNHWIVKSFTPSTIVDLSLLGIGSFTIPGIKMDIHNPPVSFNDYYSEISSFQLFQNFPNPFNPNTKISWYTPHSGRHILKLYDILGNEVLTLFDDYILPGKYEINFDASKLSSGVYLYRLSNNNLTQSRKMILVR